MAYTRKTWKNGEVITEAGLNNIEEGIAEAMSAASSAALNVQTAVNAANAASTAASAAQTAAASAKTTADNHIANKSNPHGVTISQIGAAPAYTYGTTDLTAGSSALATGKLYLKYK